jgi:hypothetical protein
LILNSFMENPVKAHKYNDKLAMPKSSNETYSAFATPQQKDPIKLDYSLELPLGTSIKVVIF